MDAFDTSMRFALLGAALLCPAGPSAASEPSAWAKATRSEARLVEGTAPPAGAGSPAVGAGLLAGIEIRLAPRFITYWRDPGDAGVPPTVSFAGSANLKSATLLFPAPHRLDEAGAQAFGYEGGVTLPVLVEPADPSRPVDLSATLDYAACHDVCLPAHADLRLTLDGTPSAEAGGLAAALAAVPRPAALGAAGAPAIVAVRPDAAGGFTAEAAVPGDAALFVEAPEGWYYEVGAAIPGGAGRLLFPVKRVERPAGAERPAAPLRLTLVAPDGAVDVPVRLDAPAP